MSADIKLTRREQKYLCKGERKTELVLTKILLVWVAMIVLIGLTAIVWTGDLEKVDIALLFALAIGTVWLIERHFLVSLVVKLAKMAKSNAGATSEDQRAAAGPEHLGGPKAT
jgi:hypothetical protein